MAGTRSACRWRGLSPRGRGKRHRNLQRRQSAGSIPAWAGETVSRARGKIAQWVYPRVGGGNAEICAADADLGGLSPRGRGKPTRDYRILRCRGSIPAWAGETGRLRMRRRCRRVYPRVGGGNVARALEVAPRTGLSPRGRGKLAPTGKAFDRVRSIPAWAGETRPNRERNRWNEVYPRVGGGNRPALSVRRYENGLSPRGRGKPA